MIGLTVVGQLRLNTWYKDFYNAIEARSVSAFSMQLLVFGIIVAALLVLNVAQTWLNQMIKLRTRERLTRDLVGQWLTPKRDFLLAGAGPISLNPDQRIHEDARHLSELTADLSIGFTQAFFLLVSFIGVLWVVSSGVLFTISRTQLRHPRLHGLVRACLCGHGLDVELVGRPAAGCPQCGALSARVRTCASNW